MGSRTWFSSQKFFRTEACRIAHGECAGSSLPSAQSHTPSLIHDDGMEDGGSCSNLSTWPHSNFPNAHALVSGTSAQKANSGLSFIVLLGFENSQAGEGDSTWFIAAVSAVAVVVVKNNSITQRGAPRANESRVCMIMRRCPSKEG